MPKVGRKKKLLRDLDHLFIVKLSELALEVPDPVAIQYNTIDYGPLWQERNSQVFTIRC
jgi:hypothetical protein